MRERCLNPGNDAYKFYGGKGITICGEWRDAKTGFPAFVAWAKEHGYEPGLTIDRIDPDDDYQNEEDENRMTALRTRTGQSVAGIAELALDAFLPPLEGTPS